ncbi:MAG: hypothetical protein FJ291_12115 [Planctomycetes bacterium]|nr:hypothetical protein [Planctomycetota bacterium]
MFEAGDTLRSADPAFESHLWVIISDPAAHPHDPVLLVSLTTWRPDKDDACLIEAGEHPAVTRRTCVSYRRSRLVERATLVAGFRLGHLRPDQRMAEPLLARIRKGATRTQFLPLEHLELLRAQGLVE